MVDYKKILVAVDGSSCSSRAATTAVGIAERFDAELHTLFVVSELVVDALRSTGKGDVKGLQESLKRDGRKYFNDIKDQAKKADVKVVEVIKDGFPSDEIVTYAKKKKIDLIVMGTHGRPKNGGRTRGLIGSVANRVIHLAECPVLVVQ